MHDRNIGVVLPHKDLLGLLPLLGDSKEKSQELVGEIMKLYSFGSEKEIKTLWLCLEGIIKYSLCFVKSLNRSFPCRENSLSITNLEEALHWQEARSKNKR